MYFFSHNLATTQFTHAYGKQWNKILKIAYFLWTFSPNNNTTTKQLDMTSKDKIYQSYMFWVKITGKKKLIYETWKYIDINAQHRT